MIVSIFGRVSLLTLMATFAFLGGCHNAAQPESAKIADRIFTGGSIVTVNDALPVAEAVAVKGGKIVAVGNRDAVMAWKGEKTAITDLSGKALLPGFIDAHGHLGQLAATLAVADLRPPPIANVGSIAQLQQVLTEFKAQHQIPDTAWLAGNGYDDTLLQEKRHPTRDDLDKISKQQPIAVMHISGHLAVVNSKALEALHIDSKTPDPAGGVIQRRPGSREPNGVLEEHAAFAVIAALAGGDPTNSKVLNLIHTAALQYASYGITTAQEDFADPQQSTSLKAAAQAGLLPIDLIVFPVWKAADTELEGYSKVPAYNHHLRYGGAKITLDGSIQGYTGYLTKPYYKAPKNVSAVLPADDEPERDIAVADEPKTQAKAAVASAWRGYPAMPQDEINQYIAHFFEKGWDIQAHTNGDAAIAQFIQAVAAARKLHPNADVRVTMIHAQTVREDQLDQMKALGIMPSFFSTHVYFWGDRHRDIFLGPERAARISPAQSAARRGMRFTIHNDTPVIPPNMLLLIAAAVNRLTTGGQVLGADQAITPQQAIKAVTLDAAWQNREQDRKGSIEVGKEADLVVLSSDPTHVDPKAIKDIKVLETIKDGQTAFHL